MNELEPLIRNDENKNDIIDNDKNKNDNDNEIKTTKRKSKRKKSTNFAIILSCATWGFLTGVERSIILPTLWLFLTNKFGGEIAKTYYGAALGAFNLSVFIFAPIYGLLAYKGFRTKFLIVVSNQMEIMGNIVYFAASEAWMVLLGRFLCGIGSGSEVPLYADVVRVTDSKVRTFYIIILLLARQVGLIIGPSMTLIFRPIKIMIGKIQLNIYNSPGFLMSIMWALQTMLVLVIYPHITKDGDLDEDDDGPLEDIRLDKKLLRKVYYQKIEDDVSEIESTYSSSSSINIRENNQLSDKFDQIIIKCRQYSNIVTLALLITVFSIYFCLISMEAILPPVTHRYFQWTEVENSAVYLIAGILVIVTFGFIQVASIKFGVSDRVLLLAGLTILLVAYLWMTGLMFQMTLLSSFNTTRIFEKTGSKLASVNFTLSTMNPLEFPYPPIQHLRIFVVCTSFGLLLHVIGLSLTVATAESLFTKALPAHEMDLAQSVLRTTINFALLIGPFLAGSLQHLPSMVFVIMVLLVLKPFILVMVKFHRLQFS